MSGHRLLHRSMAAHILSPPFFRQISLTNSPFTTSSSISLIPSTLSFSPLPAFRSPRLSSSPCRRFCSSQIILELPNADSSEIESDDEVESESEELSSEIVNEGLEGVLERNSEPTRRRKLPDLSLKEKKELASYAHSLGKKLKSQQVGKSGVTATVITALIETLEANELLKLKIHNSCPGEMEDVVRHLEEGTGSVVVSKIGRTIILYRPSLTKLKAGEKKPVQRNFVKKPLAPTLPQTKGQFPRMSGRGRRGNSRLGA